MSDLPDVEWLADYVWAAMCQQKMSDGTRLWQRQSDGLHTPSLDLLNAMKAVLPKAVAAWQARPR